MTPSFSADDYVHLVKNIDFQSVGDALDVFMHLDGREYRPLVRLSLWLNSKMGATALPFHITNLALHLCCTVLLYLIFVSRSASATGALIAALLFALHPIHTTNVHFVMGRTGLICALFYFFTVLLFIVYLKKANSAHLVGSIVCFVLALLSKEEAISLPILLLVILLLSFSRSEGRFIPQRMIVLIPYFVILGVYLGVRFWFAQDHLDQISVYTNYNVAHMAANLVQWTAGLLYPFDLYEARWALETGRSMRIAAPAGFLSLLAGLLAFILWPFREPLLKDKQLWLGLAWFAVTLWPVLGGNAHRWYLYIPSTGLCFASLAVWRQNLTTVRRAVLVVLIAALAGSYATETLKQSLIWSRQARITQAFMAQAERHNLHRLETFDVINMPFGYKSAFLFTFNSLADALAMTSGTRPVITVLSHLNLNEGTAVQVERTPAGLSFSLTPDSAAYFIFPGLLRKVPASKEAITVGHYRITIQSVTPAGLATRFDVTPIRPGAVPLFYFDGSALYNAAAPFF